MAETVSSTDLSRNLSEILSRVQQRGELFTVVRNGKTVAALSPPGRQGAAAGPRGSWRAFAESIRHLPADPSFADDLAAIQRAQDEIEFREWPKLLDTSVFIAVERGQITADQVAALLPDDETALAALTASELLSGVYLAEPGPRREQRSVFVERALASFPILPFDLPAARIHARAASDLRRAGQSIGSHDLIIAATALANGYEVATFDVRSFPRVPGLRVSVLQAP